MLGFEKEFYVEVVYFDALKRIASIKRKDFDFKDATHEFSLIVKSYRLRTDSAVLVCMRKTEDDLLLQSELLNYYKPKRESKSATLKKMIQEREKEKILIDFTTV